MSELSKIASAAAGYGVANAAASLAPLLLLPVLGIWLSLEQFGTVALLNSVISLGVPIIGIGASAAVQKRYFDLETEELRRYVAAATILIAALTVTTLLILACCAVLVDQLFGIRLKWFGLAITAAAAISIYQILLALWQASGRVTAYIIFQSIFLMLSLGVPIILVVGLNLGWKGAFVGGVVAHLSLGAVAAAFLSSDWKLPGPRFIEHTRHLISFGGPLVPHLVAGWAVAMFDRFIIGATWGLAAVGSYTFAFQLGQALNVISGSFNQAFAPWLYSVMKDQSEIRWGSVRRVVQVYSALIVAIGVTYAVVLNSLIPKWLPAYVASLDYVPWICVGMILTALYRIAGTFLMCVERTREIALGTLVTAFLSIVCNALWIPRAGPIVAGITIVASFSCLLIWTTWRARRAFGLMDVRAS